MAEFKEIGRIKISTSSDIVLSKMSESGGKIAGYVVSSITPDYMAYTIVRMIGIWEMVTRRKRDG